VSDRRRVWAKRRKLLLKTSGVSESTAEAVTEELSLEPGSSARESTHARMRMRASEEVERETPRARKCLPRPDSSLLAAFIQPIGRALLAACLCYSSFLQLVLLTLLHLVQGPAMAHSVSLSPLQASPDHVARGLRRAAMASGGAEPSCGWKVERKPLSPPYVHSIKTRSWKTDRYPFDREKGRAPAGIEFNVCHFATTHFHISPVETRSCVSYYCPNV